MTEEKDISCDMEKVHSYINGSFDLAESLDMNLIELQLAAKSMLDAVNASIEKGFRIINPGGEEAAPTGETQTKE